MRVSYHHLIQVGVLLGDGSITFPDIDPPTIHEQFGEVEGSPLFNVAATPGPVTTPSAAVALASINVVINSGAWDETCESSFKV